jgi:signal transduction histidine kinase/CheY-like chemotaxis protein
LPVPVAEVFSGAIDSERVELMQVSSTPREDTGKSHPEVAGEPQLPRLTRPLRPVVDAVARVSSSLERKMLFGFLVGAALLLAMAALSLVVIGRMDQRIDDLNRHELKVARAREMLYDVTAQSHYRAMSLLLSDTDRAKAMVYDGKVHVARNRFAHKLELMDRDDPADAATYRALRAANARYAASSRTVDALFLAGDIRAATRLHIQREHRLSHVLEDDLLTPLIARSTASMKEARAGLATDRRQLTIAVLAFSVVSVSTALMLGFLLSWSIILPIKKIGHAFGRITKGDFGVRVDVPNRDELGRLADNLNSTSERLVQFFETQRLLAARLSESNASLERASEAKSRFLASVSHELRTPMNAILGFTDALLAGLDGPLNDEQRKSLEWVQRGGRDLLGLINEILDLSKVESGRLTLRPRSLAPGDVVESVAAQLAPLAAAKGLRLTCQVVGAPPQAVLDEQRLRQVLGNLVGNAVKFSDSGEVRLVADTTSRGDLHVSVRDSGPGIPADKQEMVFDEFRQGDEETAGTGLGLAISRRLARAMGGDVTIESQPGAGAVFHLHLPCHEATVPTSASPGTTAASDGTGRLLLSIDDDPSMTPLLQKMLAGTPYQVLAARSAGEAIDDVRRLRPDAVLLDLLMPERDGNDILVDLKTDPVTRSIPVLVVSVVDLTDGPGLADARLTKPVDKAALLAALAELEPQEVAP